jgi:hypothetical protein
MRRPVKPSRAELLAAAGSTIPLKLSTGTIVDASIIRAGFDCRIETVNAIRRCISQLELPVARL